MLPETAAWQPRVAIVTEVRVRLCRAEDLPQLEWFGLFRDHREIFEQAFARQLRGENLMLVAELNGYPVGQAWIDLTKRQAEGVGFIWAVRVFPFLRNLGIGSHLMECAERLLAEHGYAQAEVSVEKDNADARRLYERLGYRLVGDIREDYSYTTPDGQRVTHTVDQWRLQKPLAGLARSAS